MAEVPHVYPEGCFFKSLSDIENKHVTIMGLGLNGGGEACVKFFLRHGAYVTVTDTKTREQLEPTLLSITGDRTLDRSRLTYTLGEHKIEDFASADCVIKNPGVKYEGNKYLVAAKNIETDLSIFLSLTKAPIIAVTGSKGKSSTASAIAFGLKKAGFNAFLGGNITVSPLTFLEQTDGITPVILELSSWQLRDLRGRKVLKPKIAVITKVLPDHQNWYNGMDSYIADKKLIYENQDETDFLIVSDDEDGYQKECSCPKKDYKTWGDVFAEEAHAQVFRYSKNILPKTKNGVFLKRNTDGTLAGYSQLPQELRSNYAKSHNLENDKIMTTLLVPGSHMRINALCAALVMQLRNIAPAQIISVLNEWQGVPHRLEAFHSWVAPNDGRKITFFNDSCSTVPESTIAAITAFEQNQILIAGGTDKNLDFLPLARVINGEAVNSPKLKQIYLLEGTGTDKLTFLLDARHIVYRGPFASLKDLLVDLKQNLTQPGSKTVYGVPTARTVLPVVFSPGATSFGMFANEFDRGEQFKRNTKELFF